VFIGYNKAPYGPIVCSFYFWREQTARKLPPAPMIGYAFTANALFIARFISAGAVFDIPLLLALHGSASQEGL